MKSIIYYIKNFFYLKQRRKIRKIRNMKIRQLELMKHHRVNTEDYSDLPMFM